MRKHAKYGDSPQKTIAFSESFNDFFAIENIFCD